MIDQTVERYLGKYPSPGFSQNPASSWAARITGTGPCSITARRAATTSGSSAGRPIKSVRAKYRTPGF